MAYNYPTYPNYQYPYLGYMSQAVPQVPTPMPTSQMPVGNVPTSNPLILDTVSGRTAADIYNVDMGKQAILIDIDNPVIYKKSRDMNNKLEMQQYDLVLHADEPKEETPKIDLNDYVKKDSIGKIVDDRVNEIVDKRLSEISFAPKTSRKKVSEE